MIWSDDVEHGHLSSHRLLTTATHTRDGQFGKATGKKWVVRVIADCAAKGETIYDEWLVRDYGGDRAPDGDDDPEVFAREADRRLRAGRRRPPCPFSPRTMSTAAITGAGNENAWGQRYAETLGRIMEKDVNHILADYDRAVIGEYPGAVQAIGREAVSEFWVGLRSAFPSATFTIHHQIGMDADMLSPRAAVPLVARRGSRRLGVVREANRSAGSCDGDEPRGVRAVGACGVSSRLFDEIAIWKQIHLHTG